MMIVEKILIMLIVMINVHNNNNNNNKYNKIMIIHSVLKEHLFIKTDEAEKCSKLLFSTLRKITRTEVVFFLD